MIRKWLTTATLSCLLLFVAAGSASAQPERSYLDPSAAVNWQCPLNRGLVSWWIALPDQQRGVIWRDICWRNHGTLTNMDPATDWVAARRLGGFGALDFVPSTNYVGVTGLGGWSGSNSTVLFWVRCRTYDASGFVAFGSTSASFPYYQILSDTQPIVAGVTCTSAAYDWNDGTWRHFGGVSLSASTRAFHNGLLVGTGVAPITQATGTKTYGIGDYIGSPNTSFSLDGQLDNLMVFNRTLSDSEVQRLYQDSLRGHPQMLAWQESIYRSPDPPGGGSPLLKILQQSALTRNKRSPANRAAETLYVIGP